MQTPGHLRNPNTTLTDALRDPDVAVPSDPGFPRGSIVLVGASVRPAAESARRAGFLPIAVDQFGDRETLQAAKYWFPLDKFQAAIAGGRSDRIVPEHTPIAIVGGLCGGYQWMESASLRFFGASPALFQCCDHPRFLRDLASRGSARFPDTVDPDGAAGVSQRPGWLLKRRSSSGGQGVTYCQGNDPIPPEASIQVPVPGNVLGVSYLGLGDRSLLLGVCRLLKKRIGSHPFVFAGAIGPLWFDDGLLDPLRRLGAAFVDASGITGPFNIDVVVDRQHLTLLEVNPRWSASMELVERFWSEWLDEPCSMFGPPHPWERRIHNHDTNSCDRRSAAPHLKRVLFASSDRVVSPDLFDRHSTQGRWIWKDVPSGETSVKRHEPLATMVARLDRISLRQAFRVTV